MAYVLDAPPQCTHEQTLVYVHAELLSGTFCAQESVRRASDSIYRSPSDEAHIDELLSAVTVCREALPAEEVCQHLFCSLAEPYQVPLPMSSPCTGAPCLGHFGRFAEGNDQADSPHGSAREEGCG